MTFVETFSIGTAFGFILERAGLADCRKLAAQFYLTDMTVFKVMFTAIVTTMLALFWMDQLGFVDPLQIQPLTTYLVPQTIGGVLFGIGFIVGGYCPGTSCAAAAIGRRDALTFLGGMALGMGLFHIAGEPAIVWSRTTELGPLRLDEVFGVSRPWVVVLLTVAAVAGFWLAEEIEHRKRPST